MDRFAAAPTPIEVDRQSLLARIDGKLDLAKVEGLLNEAGLTLDARFPSPAPTLGEWLAAGAPGARDRWLDPVDQFVAGFDATLADGRRVSIGPAPRRSAGPDLTTLFVGGGGQFGRLENAWLRVHRRGAVRPTTAHFAHDRDVPPNAGELALIDTIVRALAHP